ncbi:MAG: hypothetical protein RBG13Loki_3266 [Promethearchaeota archaeon CR_4]|nr:MAG: hypothetical protein RBG13Loki_3266 [Candidatus Lokiarchaeota archaeon CR_4]
MRVFEEKMRANSIEQPRKINVDISISSRGLPQNVFSRQIRFNNFYEKSKMEQFTV